MFHPTRGGTRGGAAEFKWSAVQADKDRENYLGHSINAPAGRWQKNKDIHWYSRENEVGVDALTRAAEKKAEEIKRIKEMEEDALAVALGFAPKDRAAGGDGEGTGANGIVVKKSDKELELERAEKEEKAARKAAKRERKEMKEMERSVRKEIKRAEKGKRTLDRSDGDRQGSRYRSRSPEHRVKEYRERSPRRTDERRVDGPDGRERQVSRYRSRSPDRERERPRYQSRSPGLRDREHRERSPRRSDERRVDGRRDREVGGRRDLREVDGRRDRDRDHGK